MTINNKIQNPRFTSEDQKVLTLFLNLRDLADIHQEKT